MTELLIDLIIEDTPETTTEIFRTYPKGTLNKSKYKLLNNSSLDRYTFLAVNVDNGDYTTSNSLCSINTKLKQYYGHNTQLHYDNSNLCLLTSGKYEIVIPSVIIATNDNNETIFVKLHNNLMANELKRITENYSNLKQIVNNYKIKIGA